MLPAGDDVQCWAGRSTLPGFGYRFLRQRRQHNGPSTDLGITIIGRAASAISADDGFENCALATGTKPAAIQREMPKTNLRRSHQGAGDVVLTSQFLSVFPGCDQGKRTFA
jgi:hypothetical protein